MSAKSHKSDYVILATLGIISAVVILALILSGWIREDGKSQWFRTTYSRNIEGTIVCYTLFERLGIPVRRSERPLLPEALEEIDVLFVIDPLLPVLGSELSGLTGWVRGGGVIVCSGVGGELLRLFHGMDVPASGQRRARPAPSANNSSPGQPTNIPPDAAEMPLARDVSTVHLTTSEVLRPGDPETSPSFGQVEALLTDATGLRVAARRIGAGRAIVLADSSFLANGWIGKEDNALAAANLAYYALSQARGDRVAFDEYHFGYGHHETSWSVMGTLLLRTNPGWAVVSLALAGLLFLIYKGRRFGTRRAAERPRRRSKLEYVQAVGATYRAAGAHRLTFRLIFQWFRRRASRVVGLPAGASSDDIASGLARRSGRPPEGYLRVLRQCEEALAGPRLSSRRASALLGQLAQIESETLNGHPRSK